MVQVLGLRATAQYYNAVNSRLWCDAGAWPTKELLADCRWLQSLYIIAGRTVRQLGLSVST